MGGWPITSCIIVPKTDHGTIDQINNQNYNIDEEYVIVMKYLSKRVLIITINTTIL
jgi:hypothetical protein